MMIIAEHLEQTYTSGGHPLTVLKDVSLSVDPQGFIAIVGPSGSGKTTLLGLLAGLDRPTAGRVELDGQDLGPLSEDERARLRSEKVGFVFQTFQLLPTLTALENVLVPVELRPGGVGDDGAEAEERARDLLARVGLGERTHHYPNQPKILFADEPTGNLDTETGKAVADLLVALNTEAQTTLVLVTHDQELAGRAHRIVRLSAGTIVS
jgi:putative ABC transport system ATP-binding protein